MEHYKISKLLHFATVSKKMNWNKWFIQKSIFCQQEYKI